METPGMTRRLLDKCLEFGADDAGICRALDLLSGPAHRRFPLPEGIGEQHSVLVMALSHPRDEPELDYFIKREGARYGNSAGNRRLMDISSRIGRWLAGQGIASTDLHYYVERGGVFLKDAAVLAGLGTIGANNLLIHPGLGTRVRFRAHLVEVTMTPAKRLDFDPCSLCPRPCLTVCPEGALEEGRYHTQRCQARFDRDYEEGIPVPAEGDGPACREVRYCRECEFACVYKGDKEN